MQNLTDQAAASAYQVHHPAHALQDLIEAALMRSGCLANRSLRFEVTEADVVLKGVVGSYYQKQIAQESLRSIRGLGNIRNEIEVIAS